MPPIAIVIASPHGLRIHPIARRQTSGSVASLRASPITFRQPSERRARLPACIGSLPERSGRITLCKPKHPGGRSFLPSTGRFPYDLRLIEIPFPCTRSISMCSIARDQAFQRAQRGSVDASRSMLYRSTHVGSRNDFSSAPPGCFPRPVLLSQLDDLRRLAPPPF